MLVALIPTDARYKFYAKYFYEEIIFIINIFHSKNNVTYENFLMERII